MAMFDPRTRDVAVPWYRRADYARILEIMDDAEDLSPTFNQWQGRAEKLVQKAARAGKTVHRVRIDPEKFVAWCAARGLDVDADARSKFAADPANWMHRDKH